MDGRGAGRRSAFSGYFRRQFVIVRRTATLGVNQLALLGLDEAPPFPPVLTAALFCRHGSKDLVGSKAGANGCFFAAIGQTRREAVQSSRKPLEGIDQRLKTLAGRNKEDHHIMPDQQRKMSEIMKEMSQTLLRNPNGEQSSEAAHVALLFANAWPGSPNAGTGGGCRSFSSKSKD